MPCARSFYSCCASKSARRRVRTDREYDANTSRKICLLTCKWIRVHEKSLANYRFAFRVGRRSCGAREVPFVRWRLDFDQRKNFFVNHAFRHRLSTLSTDLATVYVGNSRSREAHAVLTSWCQKSRRGRRNDELTEEGESLFYFGGRCDNSVIFYRNRILIACRLIDSINR